ncbi:MAG: 4Fe-4S dicluster domain-containing protein [Armatimonadota bacterium]
MREWTPERKIVYEEELDQQFGKEISRRAEGAKIDTCIQCGTCSGTCPLSIYMDYTPRRIIAMTRAGFKKDVLNSFTIWLCASCYQCTVECPKQIRITDLMYALKQQAIADGVYPKRFRIPVLAREFFKAVHKHGRNSEGRLILAMYLKSNPFGMLKQMVLGTRLFLQGRIGPQLERIKTKPGEKGDLRIILRAVERSK